MPHDDNAPVAPAAPATPAGLAAQNAGRSVALVVDGLVHDLNNPLTTVLANLEMLARRVRGGAALDDDDRDALEETLEAAVRVAALLREARAVSRGAAGRARVDVVLRAAIRATKQVARDRGIRPLMHEPPVEGAENDDGVDVEVLVRAEEPRLALALTLLADSVLRRMRGGPGTAITFGARVDGDDVVAEVVVVGAVDANDPGDDGANGDDGFDVARAALGDAGVLRVAPLDNGLVLSVRLSRDPGSVNVPPGLLR
jgi:signal transduction histidine kinase